MFLLFLRNLNINLFFDVRQTGANKSLKSLYLEKTSLCGTFQHVTLIYVSNMKAVFSTFLFS